jgi:hypothetical protein
MLKKIQQLIHENHRQTIHELADTTGIGYGVCQEILTLCGPVATILAFGF